MKAVAPGAVWDPSQMSIMYSDVYVDREPDKRTSDNVKSIADSVTGMLVWTIDYPSAKFTIKLPIFDIETWIEETKFGTRTSYSFYSKPMTKPIVIPADSAIPDSRQIPYQGLAGG